jgi:hypothetical protein
VGSRTASLGAGAARQPGHKAAGAIAAANGGSAASGRNRTASLPPAAAAAATASSSASAAKKKVSSKTTASSSSAAAGGEKLNLSQALQVLQGLTKALAGVGAAPASAPGSGTAGAPLPRDVLASLQNASLLAAAVAAAGGADKKRKKKRSASQHPEGGEGRGASPLRGGQRRTAVGANASEGAVEATEGVVSSLLDPSQSLLGGQVGRRGGALYGSPSARSVRSHASRNPGAAASSAAAPASVAMPPPTARFFDDRGSTLVQHRAFAESSFAAGSQHPHPQPAMAVAHSAHAHAMSSTPLMSKPSRMRLEFAKAWINALPTPSFAKMPMGLGQKLAPMFRDGTTLCAILHALVPSTDKAALAEGMTPRPRSRAACLSNAERALQALYKCRVRHTRLPTADELVDEREDRVVSMVAEILEVFALRKARANANAVVRWAVDVLDKYGATPASLRSAAKAMQQGAAAAPVRGLWQSMRSGGCLAVLAHYYCGDSGKATAVGPAVNPGGVDLTSVFSSPAVNGQAAANIATALVALASFGVKAACSVDMVLGPGPSAHYEHAFEACSPLDEDDDMALYQLFLVYEAVGKQSTKLPVIDGMTFASPYEAHMEVRAGLAHGVNVGVAAVTPQHASGAVGGVQTFVVGHRFTDSDGWTEVRAQEVAAAMSPPRSPPAMAAPSVESRQASPLPVYGRRSRSNSPSMPFQDTTSNFVAFVGSPDRIVAANTRSPVVMSRYSSPVKPVPAPAPAAVVVSAKSSPVAPPREAVAEVEVTTRPSTDRASGPFINGPTSAQIVTERDRLYQIALARATGSRAQSAAVAEVATKWANVKAIAWAVGQGASKAFAEKAVALFPVPGMTSLKDNGADAAEAVRPTVTMAPAPAPRKADVYTLLRGNSAGTLAEPESEFSPPSQPLPPVHVPEPVADSSSSGIPASVASAVAAINAVPSAPVSPILSMERSRAMSQQAAPPPPAAPAPPAVASPQAPPPPPVADISPPAPQASAARSSSAHAEPYVLTSVIGTSIFAMGSAPSSASAWSAASAGTSATHPADMTAPSVGESERAATFAAAAANWSSKSPGFDELAVLVAQPLSKPQRMVAVSPDAPTSPAHSPRRLATTGSGITQSSPVPFPSSALVAAGARGAGPVRDDMLAFAGELLAATQANGVIPGGRAPDVSIFQQHQLQYQQRQEAMQAAAAMAAAVSARAPPPASVRAPVPAPVSANPTPIGVVSDPFPAELPYIPPPPKKGGRRSLSQSAPGDALSATSATEPAPSPFPVTTFAPTVVSTQPIQPSFLASPFANAAPVSFGAHAVSSRPPTVAVPLSAGSPAEFSVSNTPFRGLAARKEAPGSLLQSILSARAAGAPAAGAGLGFAQRK